MSLLLKIQKSFTKCLILHPVMRPNKGPQMQQYLAEQAIGLASSLRWEIIKGPFWEGKQSIDLQKSIIAKQNYIYVESDSSEIRDGTYIRTSVGNGIYYKQGIIFQGHSTQSDGDLYQQWRNVKLRQSLANSSLIRVKKTTQKTFFTKGKLDIISSYIQYNNVDCLFVNTELKPGQVRNLKKVIQAKINGKPLPKGYGLGDNSESQTQLLSSQDNNDIQQQNSTSPAPFRRIRIFDRFSIILQIFAKRVTSTLSKLQIQLSYLNYIRTRLVRRGSVYSSSFNIFHGDLMKAQQINLEIISAKQRRAHGIMSGQGQSQLQVQRRTVKDKIASINKRIEQQRQVRNQNQKKSQRRNQISQDIPVIALVGYTNVGKSALMNKILKKKEVQSEDMLFQTLRTTSRHFYLPSGRKAILLDTIGFITNLPSQLFQSFKVTLEQINHADIIIHLRDISHPENNLQYKTIMDVLTSLPNGKKWIQQGNVLQVWNKVDLIKITQKTIQQSQYVMEQKKNEYITQSITRQSNSIIVKTQENNTKAQEINKKDLIKISATKGTGIPEFLNQLEQMVVKLTKNNQYKFVYSFQKHYKVLEWLKQNTNLPHDFPQKHNFTRTKQFPSGNVEITLQLDDKTYGKFIKFMGLTNPDQKVGKRKQMPPAEGW